MAQFEDSIAGARRCMQGARRIAVLTGAGMSAESGVPTFRDAQTGLWARFDPAQLASEDGFRADPPLVWRWYASRREGVTRAQPHAGHRALAAAETDPRLESFTLITQNVDGLHRRAGSHDLIEIHGSIMLTLCLKRCGFEEYDPDRLPPGEPPKCPRCGSWLRPGVVWFGETLNPARLAAAEAASRACDVMLVVGTSGVVYPAAALPGLARRAGASVIVVNSADSDLDGEAQIVLRGTAAGVLPELLSPA